MVLILKLWKLLLSAGCVQSWGHQWYKWMGRDFTRGIKATESMMRVFIRHRVIFNIVLFSFPFLFSFFYSLFLSIYLSFFHFFGHILFCHSNGRVILIVQCLAPSPFHPWLCQIMCGLTCDDLTQCLFSGNNRKSYPSKINFTSRANDHMYQY